MLSFIKICHNYFLQDQSKLLFGDIAIKQNMTDVCIQTIKSIEPNSSPTLEWLYKMFLEAKCLQKANKYNEVSIYILK